MKNIFAILTIGMIITLSMTSCEDELEERYTNPDRTGEASIGKFFTKMLNNDRVRPSYWNVRTFLAPQTALYTQSVSFTNANQRYQQQLSYIDDFWRDYYTPTGSGIVAHLREMEKTYASLSDEEKTKEDVFMNAARIVYADQTSQMVDMFGDIPFSEAGSLNLTGQPGMAKFDDAAEIYTALLALLEENAAYFEAGNVNPTALTAFKKQDILFQGNLDGWRRYANSLRLRLLMRISFADESKAEVEVMTMLNNAGDYPLISDPSHDALLEALTTYSENMGNALTEITSHIAPEFLLDDVLKPANDPRIRVWFDKNANSGVQNADYFAMPSGISATEQETNINARKYAVLDSSTFLFNRAFPGIVFTSAETNFLKAEAFQRWGNSDDAENAYKQGVTDAVNFMFYLNRLGGGDEEDVTEEEINDLLNNATVAFTGTSAEKLDKIWTQKWLSFGFMQSIQSWAEVRRTDTPNLDFTPDTSTPNWNVPSSRLLYPSSEKTFNAENYARVAAEDIATGKIFWDVN